MPKKMLSYFLPFNYLKLCSRPANLLSLEANVETVMYQKPFSSPWSTLYNIFFLYMNILRNILYKKNFSKYKMAVNSIAK